MAHIQGPRSTMWNGISAKIHDATKMIGAIKGAYETGKALYGVYNAVAPYAATIATTLL